MKTCRRCGIERDALWAFSPGSNICKVCRRIDRHNQRARSAGATGTFTTHDWIATCKAHGDRCAGCGKAQHYEALTMDHKVSMGHGGQNTIDNIQPLCASCNTSKSNRTNWSGLKRGAR